MWKSQKADNRKTKKSIGNWGGAGLVFLALLLVLSGAAYLALQEAVATPPAVSSIPGTKNDIDYNSRCDALHAVINRVLANQNLVVSDVRQDPREVTRQKIDGKIRWNAKSSLIENTGASSAAGIRRALELALKQSGGVVLKVEPDHYHGYAVMRMDIGFQGQLGGDPLTIISDRLYIVETVRKPVAAAIRQKTSVAHKGEIALIIDDFGFRQDMITEFAAIRKPFTFSVIPFKQYSKDAAAKGLASGHQIMIHLPMEPLSGTEPSESPATISVGMSSIQIRELIVKSTDSLPGAVGVNNHQGSKATADRRTMEAVMQELSKKKLFFVDSRTHGQSVAAEVARHEKVKTAENDLFIDGIAEVSYVKKQLRTAGEMAVRMGNVTVIGHARPATAAALREMIPELESKGIQFVFVSQLVR